MVKLSDLQVALLLEEIAFAMRVGKPVGDSMRRLQSRRLGGVARAAGAIAAGLDRGEDVSVAFESASTKTSSQAAAAILASKQCGEPGLIGRVANQLRRRSELSKDTRIAWIYPWILMAVGYGVAVGVMAPLIRGINGDEIQWSGWIVGLAGWLESNWWLPPIVAFVFFLAFLGWLFTRTRFPRNARMQLFCDSLADQISHGIPEDVAVQTAANISGDTTLMSMSQPSMKSPEVVRIISMSQSFLDSAAGVNAQQAMIARLRYMASVYGERARHRNYLWSRLLPRVAMIVFGGGMTLAYAWWVIAPVYVQVAQW